MTDTTPPPQAGIEERARELLAAHFDQIGATAVANRIRRADPEDAATISADEAITAFAAAIRALAAEGGAE